MHFRLPRELEPGFRIDKGIINIKYSIQKFARKFNSKKYSIQKFAIQKIFNSKICKKIQFKI